jgi:hypothetical protein
LRSIYVRTARLIAGHRSDRVIGARPQSYNLGVHDRGLVSFPAGTLQRWDRWVNEHPVRDDEPNRVTFAGAGRPATRDEIFAFVAENNARYTREHPGG